MWASVAPLWAEHADYVDVGAAEVSATMIRLAAPPPGDRVLELACGAGGLGLAVAPLVAPGGEVVLSDVVPELSSFAGSRAAARGIDNVTTAVIDLEDIRQPDASFDLVLCREGLMFALDPGRAVEGIRRVLRPGGRFGVAVWGSQERNPWLGVLFDAVRAETGVPVPPPGVPGPFALGAPGRLESLLAGAGLASVHVMELEMTRREGSFDDFWKMRMALAGPLAQRVTSLPSATRAAIRERAREAVRPFETATGLELPAMCLIGIAQRT
jgi:SAM-dependent methyltransferase